MRVTSGSWDGDKVILCDQVVEVGNVDGRLNIARKERHYDDYLMRRRLVGTYFPHQSMSVRWWPKVRVGDDSQNLTE